MTGRGKKAAAPKKKANGYKMPPPIPSGEVIVDTLMKKKWRIGPSIGVGGFGEIYSACEHENSPKKGAGYPYVIKIEPHENGPLFVEKNFYMRNANKDDITKFMKSKKLSSLGMPSFYGNGSHEFKGEKYRYLVLERYNKDIWSIFKDNGRKFPTTTVFQLGLQMLDVLEYIHSRGYVHADIKGANILLGLKKGTEQQAYLLDFGLATRVSEKEFKPDPKCAHNGTIEYTSRDAHLGVATMRGDLEILGYNMLQWIVGELPWEKALKQPKTVQDLKEGFMKQVRTNLLKYKTVPEGLIKFFEYINTLKPKDTPDYGKCQKFFESYLKSERVTKNTKLDFSAPKKTGKKNVTIHESDNDDEGSDDDENVPLKKAPVKKPRQNVKTNKRKEPSDNEESDGDENVPLVRKSPLKKQNVAGKSKKREESDDEQSDNQSDGDDESYTLKTRKSPTKKPKQDKRKKVVAKRKSLEPISLAKIKKIKSKATPPAKINHTNIATQTSVEKKDLRSVSFDSPISEILGEKRLSKVTNSANSSVDIFEDSFVESSKKVRGRRKLMDVQEVTTKVVRKRVTVNKPKKKSWKDSAAIVNGRSPPVS